MRISTRGRYALMLMLDLAVNNTGELVKIKDISDRQSISEKYLEQIISTLKKAGYVKSLRGALGGYRLAKDPKEYTVGMILRLTEGSMAPVACLDDDEDGVCERESECVSLRLWKMIDDAVSGVIDHVTLQDMLDWELEKSDFYVI
ncbi:MAG: Rrf2 family transcriptional regulator [Lachnospiraceae bacterium]|nr:Rrf2 family transcriptional regulator [Lachnospiraceae bacterium]